MSADKDIELFLSKACGERVFSAYQLYIEKDLKPNYFFGGKTSYWPDARPIHEHSYFDLGSLTKVIVTTSLLALGVEKQKFQLESPVKHYAHETKGNVIGELLLQDLASHCSGLKAWIPLYERMQGNDFIQFLITHSDEVIESPPRTRAVYSDLGFILLGYLIERTERQTLSALFNERIARPLKLTHSTFGPLKDPLDAAATEFSVLTQSLIQGKVFDENCAHLGGIAGHAGLFSSASDLAPFCREWLKAFHSHSSWLKPSTAKQFATPSKFATSTWALGWDTKSHVASSCGRFFSSFSFGHLGFPGCSIWIDPQMNGFAIFLTNRIHPSRLDERIKRIRPLLHEKISHFWRQGS